MEKVTRIGAPAIVSASLRCVWGRNEEPSNWQSQKPWQRVHKDATLALPDQVAHKLSGTHTQRDAHTHTSRETTANRKYKESLSCQIFQFSVPFSYFRSSPLGCRLKMYSLLLLLLPSFWTFKELPYFLSPFALPHPPELCYQASRDAATRLHGRNIWFGSFLFSFFRLEGWGGGDWNEMEEQMASEPFLSLRSLPTQTGQAETRPASILICIYPADDPLLSLRRPSHKLHPS